MSKNQFGRLSASACCAVVFAVGVTVPMRATAQVVQLPSTRSFSYSGTVWAPDAGTVTLRGNRYSRSSSAGRGLGPYAGRANGLMSGGNSMTATVQIIDMQALDEAILSTNVPPRRKSPAPAAGGAPTDPAATAEAARELIGVVRSTPRTESRRVNPDPGEWQRVMHGGQRSRAEMHPALAESKIHYYLQQAKQAENLNRMYSARVYYRMAAEAMTPEMVARYHRILAEREKAAEEQERAADNNDARKQF